MYKENKFKIELLEEVITNVKNHCICEIDNCESELNKMHSGDIDRKEYNERSICYENMLEEIEAEVKEMEFEIKNKKENKMKSNIEKAKLELKELIVKIRKTKLDIKDKNHRLSKEGNTEDLNFYSHIYKLESNKIEFKDDYRSLHLASCLLRKISIKGLLKLNNDTIQQLILEFGLEKEGKTIIDSSLLESYTKNGDSEYHTKGKKYNKPNIEKIKMIIKNIKEQK